MELELGLKITRTREDVSSSVDFRFSKDPFGPLVLSRETDSRFIIIIHLKGFKKEGIEIEINKEGNMITIRGRKPVEEMVLIRWMAWKKEVELRAFRKVFLIPDIVDLDKIKARFDDDDATLTVTMPKRVKGLSGFKLEQEEEEEEESVDFGDVSEVENREETQSREEVEEENAEREDSDEHSETQREEDFGEMMEDKERESQVFEGEEKGFSEGLDEEETQIEDDDLEKIQQIDEQDKILEFAEEETVQQELADSNTESEDSGLKKLPDIIEQEDNQEVMEQKVSEETKSDDIGSGAVEEIEEQEIDEIGRTSESRAMEKKTTDGDDDGLSKAQGSEEPERHNEESKIQEMVEEETGGQEKKKIVMMEIKNKDANEEFYGKETPIEDDDLEKSQHIDEQDKILEFGEEETVGQQEFADSNTETEDSSSLRKIPDILEQENNQDVMEQKDSQAETKSDDFGSRAFEEIEKQEPREQLDGTSKSRATAKKTADDDGLSKVQGIEEPERRNEVSKIQKMVEGETSDHEKKKNRDPKEDVDAEMGEGSTPNIERKRVVAEDDITETETKAEKFESEKPEADKVDKKHELVEKKEEEEENTKGRRTSEDRRSLIKLQENEEQHSKGRKRQYKHEKIKELVEEKTPEVETNIANDVPKPVQETEAPEADTVVKTDDEGIEGKEKKKSVKMEIENMGEGFAPNIAETETKPEDFDSEKLGADEVDKIHKLVEKTEEEDANVRRKSKDRSLIKLQENEEPHSKGRKRQEKQENIKELVEEKAPEAETNIANDVPKPVQGIKSEVGTLGETGDEGKEGEEKKKSVNLEVKNRDVKEEVDAKLGVPNILETETKPEEFESDQLKADEVDKIHELVEKREEEEETYAKVGTQSEDISLIKPQEIGEQQSQGQKRHNEHEKIRELVDEKTPEAETDIANDTLKPVQERCEGKQKIQKLFQEETKKQPEEYKETMEETGKKINDAGSRKVQEIIRQQELDEPERCEKERKTLEVVKSKTSDEEKDEKEIAETETKEQESCRPKILREQEKIQELVEEKTEILKNGKVKEEEEIAEKKTEFGDDDMSRKVRDIERGSDAMKGQEEKENIQELVLGEKVSDGGKKIVAEAIAENYKSRKVQEIDEQQSHEEDKRGNQFQKLIGGETSGQGEVEDVESEKKTREVDKRLGDSAKEAQEIEGTDSDISGKYGKGDTFQELQEDRTTYQYEQEEEKEDEADRPERGTGTIEQELVNLNSQVEQENVEDGEKTQELVDEKINNCKEEESENKSNDVIRKVQGTKEQELFEPKKNHVSKIKEVEEKTAESEIEAECGGLSKVHGIEEQESHEPKIHKERDKTRITGIEEPSGQEKEEEEKEKIVESMTITEKEKSPNAQEIKDERPDKESHEKRYKIQELVEAGHNDHKEEQKDEKLIVKAKRETKEDTSKKVQEIEKQESDGLKRSLVQDKKQKTEEKEIYRAMEEKEIVERKTKLEDVSLRKVQDDEDLEMSKPYKRQEEDKIQEPVEMGTSDYKEKVKKQDVNDILRSQEPGKPNLDECERHGEQKNIPQGEDKIQEPVEMVTCDYREKVKKQDGDDIPQSVEEEKVENIAELEGKVEDESSDNFHEFEELKSYEDWTDETRQKRNDFGKEEAADPKESEEKEKTRAVEEKEIVERRTKARDGSLRKVQDDAELELSKPYKRQEEDKVQESVETGTSDYREKVKKQDGNETLRRKELGKPTVDEFKRHGEKRSIPQLVDEEKMENIAEPGGKLEDDNSGKFHEFELRKSYDDWTHEEREKMKDLVKQEATGPKDKRTAEAGHNDHKEEQQEETVIANAELKAEEDTSKKIQEIEKQKSDELQRSSVQDKMQETEEKEKTRAMEENEIVERTKTKDASLRKVRDGKEPESIKPFKRRDEDKIQELVEMETSDYREKVKKQDGDDILRSQETGKLDLGELDRHCKQRNIHQPVEDEKGEGERENFSEPCGKLEDSSSKFHEFQKQKSFEDWRQEEIENLVEEEATGPKDKHTEGKGEPEEKRYEKVAQTKTKVEDEINKEVEENQKEEENFVDDSVTKIQESEKEESEIHEKLDIVQDFVEDEKGDQEDEEVEEAAAVEANYDEDTSRILQTIKEQEERKEQKKIPKRNDPEVEREDEERIAENETKEKEAHVQELEGKREIIKDYDGESRRGQKIKQEKTVETKSDYCSVRKVRETKVQESNEKKDPKPEEKIEELERKETSNHGVKLVTEEDSLIKGQEFLEKESSNVSKGRPVGQEKIQQLKDVEKREDEEKSEAETKTNAGKSRKLEMKELDESEENEELKKIRKPMEEKKHAPEKEKGIKGNEKIAEVEMQAKIGIRMKDQETKRQEPYELLENEEHDKIPEPIVEGTKYQREEEKRMADREIEEMKRKSEDVRSRKVQKIKAEESDGLEKHMKLSGFQENQSVEEKIQDHGEEVNEAEGYKAVLKKKSMEDSSQSQDVEEKGSDQTERYAEEEKIQELMAEEEGKEEYDIREGEQDEKAKRIPQVESKANDNSSKKNETERLRGKKQNEDHQEVVEIETSDQRKEEREEKIVGKAVTRDEYDSSRKNHEHEEEQSDKVERHGEEEMSGSLAKEETSNDKEENKGNRAGAETPVKDDGFIEEELAIVVRHREKDKKQLFLEKDTSGKAKENRNQETKSRDDSSRKTRENEKQESHEQKRNYEEQDKKNLGPNYCRNEEDGKEDKEIAEAEGPRKLKGIEKRESTKMVERHDYQDNITDLVEEKMNDQEGEDKKSTFMEVLAKSEDHESKGPERLKKQDKSRELVQQRSTDNLKDEETAKTETKIKDKESRKTHQLIEKETGEEERRKETGRIKELVDDRIHSCREKENRETECEDGSSKKIQEIDKEESTEPGRDEKRDKIQPVDSETSEDDEEELEVEVEDSEEDWEAEVIQEMDSDEDNEKIRQIRRIKLGFRLVGGSTLFMSLIVIVIRFIRSKRTIRCYKF